MTKQRIRILTVPEQKIIPIQKVIKPTHQGGFLQLASGEVVFRISIKGGLKIDTVKLNIDFLGATMSLTAEPGFVYITAKAKESAVHKFLNSITDEGAIKLAEMNGFDSDQFHFPENENPDPEIPDRDNQTLMQKD